MTTETTELEKMSAVREQSQPIGEFLDWLAGQGILLMKYTPVIYERWPWESKFATDGSQPSYYRAAWHGPDDGVHGPPEEYEGDDEPMMWRESIERMLARFFEIDLNAIEEERRALLDELRERNAS